MFDTSIILIEQNKMTASHDLSGNFDRSFLIDIP